MNDNTLPRKVEMPREVEMSLAITGRYVDEQVAKGRALDDVLAEDGQSDSIWRNKNALRWFSRAVASSFS